MVSTPDQPTPPVTPVTPPPRAVPRLRTLGWRNPWTMLLGALAAFQAGVIVTLLWTSGREGAPRVADRPLPAGRVTAPLPAGGSAPSGPTTGPTTTEPTTGPTTTEPTTGPTPTEPTTGPTTSTPTTSTPTTSTPTTSTPSTTTGTAHHPGHKPRVDEPTRPPIDAGASPPGPDEAAMIEVEVVSEPEGATVRIGGAVWGVTPLTALLPASGKVVVNLELAGFQPARVPWSASSGRRTVRAALVPLESP